mgnify:CR=1 FL=1
MTKNYDELFQDRVDELLLIEQRVDRRSEKLIDMTNDYKASSQKVLDDLVGKIGGIDDSIVKINAASDQARDHILQSENHARYTMRLFFVTAIASILILLGTLWWVHHVTSTFAEDKAALAAIEHKLQHTPVIVHFKGKDYVRIVTDSETSFNHADGSDVSGSYAEVWHMR